MLKIIKQFAIAFLILCSSVTSFSQTITVRDLITRETLQGVIIQSKEPKALVVTNARGQANIIDFEKSQSIAISYLGYLTDTFSYSQLKAKEFNVELKENKFSIKNIIISSNRWEQKKIATPNRIETINMKEAAFQNPQTSADLLGMSGYAFIQKSQLGGGSPMLRGMATNRVLLVVDGVRMNNAIFRSGNLQSVISIDANAIERSEILFGPGSVSYGSDAVGGVMSFNTLEPKYVLSENKKPILTGSVMARSSSANTERTGHIDFNVGSNNWAFTTSVTYSGYGDLRSGSKGGVNYFYRPSSVLTIENKDYMVANEDSTLQVGSKYSQLNLMQKVKYKASKYLELDYGFHFSQTSKFNRYDRLYVMQTMGPYKNKLRWAEWYYGPQKWQMNRLGLQYSKGNKIFDNLSVVAAYQFFEESRFDREFMFREIRMQKENVHALSLNLDLDKKLNDKLSLTYGAEAVYNKVVSVATLTHVITKASESTVTRYPDGSTWESYGAYLNAKYQLYPKWTLSGGLRYNQFFINAIFDTTYFPFPYSSTRMSNGSISSSLGMVYSPSNTWQIYTSVARGFRAPNVDDMGKVFESVPGYLVVPNPGLKAEKVYNFEIGTAKTFGKHIKIDATAYYTWLTDAMVRKDFTLNGDTTIRYLGNKSRIQAVQNVTNIQVYGLQAGVEFFYKGLSLKSNFSYQNGREQTPDSLVYYPLRHAAPTFGSTHLTFERKKFKLDFYTAYNLKMDPEDLALTEKTNASYARNQQGFAYVAGWQTFNLKAAYYPSQYVGLTFGIENLTDKMYRPYSSGINAPGRNFIASMRARF